MSILHGTFVTFGIVLMLASAGAARAQSCAIPSRLPAAEARARPDHEVRTGPVARYTLALSWSPQYCRGGGANDVQQCGPDARFGFILHGLWPDSRAQNSLAWCRPAQPLAADLVRQNFCATPSVRLQQHEWAKHGTCMTDDPVRYFTAGRALFEALQWPDMDGLSRVRPTVAAFKTAFSAANRGIRQDMVSLDVNEGGWLQEVKLCLNLDFRPTRCPKGTRGAADRQQLKIWRRE